MARHRPPVTPPASWRIVDADTGELLISHLLYGDAHDWLTVLTRTGREVVMVQDTPTNPNGQDA